MRWSGQLLDIEAKLSMQLKEFIHLVVLTTYRPAQPERLFLKADLSHRNSNDKHQRCSKPKEHKNYPRAENRN
jgi:hypothetical protein